MTSYVYVAKIDGESPVKIGHTSNPAKRLAALRTFSPFGASFEAVYATETREDAKALEKSAHEFLRDLRLVGREWFDIEPRSAAAVVRAMAAYDGIRIGVVA
jgi:hypothetical protein